MAFDADYKKTAKELALRKVNQAFFGKGFVGRLLEKKIDAKFGDKASGADPQEEALTEQQVTIQRNQATLERIERVVMNIADNIYNIAGMVGHQVTSMEEARRVQQEQMSRDKAAAEEAANETKAVLQPTAAATGGDRSQGGDKKGVVGQIAGAFMKQRSAVTGLLKKFAVVAGVVAVGTAAAAATAYALSPDGDTEEAAADYVATEAESTPPPSASNTPTTQAPEEPNLATLMSMATGGAPPPSSSPSPSSAGATPTSTSPVASATPAAAAAAAPAPAAEPVAQTPEPAPAATPMAPPPAAATQAAAGPSKEEKIAALEQEKEALDKRIAFKRKISESAIEGIQKRGQADTEDGKDRIQKTKDNMAWMEEQANKRKAAIDEEIKGLKSSPASSASGGGEGGGAAPPPAPPAASAGGGGGAAPVAPSVSTGSSIGTQSSAVAAAGEAVPASGGAQTIDTRTPESSVGGGASNVPVPSPIANRGSLDKNTTFEASV